MFCLIVLFWCQREKKKKIDASLVTPNICVHLCNYRTKVSSHQFNTHERKPLSRSIGVPCRRPSPSNPAIKICLLIKLSLSLWVCARVSGLRRFLDINMSSFFLPWDVDGCLLLSVPLPRLCHLIQIIKLPSFSTEPNVFISVIMDALMRWQ